MRLSPLTIRATKRLTCRIVAENFFEHDDATCGFNPCTEFEVFYQKCFVCKFRLPHGLTHESVFNAPEVLERVLLTIMPLSKLENLIDESTFEMPSRMFFDVLDDKYRGNVRWFAVSMVADLMRLHSKPDVVGFRTWQLGVMFGC